jgi:hypothetical protein
VLESAAASEARLQLDANATTTIATLCRLTRLMRVQTSQLSIYLSRAICEGPAATICPREVTLDASHWLAARAAVERWGQA